MNIQAIQQIQQETIYEKTVLCESKHTSIKYKTAYNSINTYINKNNITEINNDNINKIILSYIEYLKNDLQLSNNTIKQYMIIINKLFKTDCELKIKNRTLPKAEKPKLHYITYDQYQEIMQYLEKQQKMEHTKHQHKILIMNKMIIKLLFNTGLRIHELLKITIDEINKLKQDYNNSYQLEITGKGNKNRTIILTSITYANLKQYIMENCSSEQTYIFQSNSKKKNIPVSVATIERHFQRLAKELDNYYNYDNDDENNYTHVLKPHALRHSYAVTRLSNGMAINEMQEMLGHNDIKTTQIYTRINADGLSDAQNRATINGE